ncbi:MAG: DNA translocase FtsK [Anaerolineales bacterium]
MTKNKENNSPSPIPTQNETDAQLSIIRFLRRYRRFGNDIGGVALLAFGLMTFSGVIAPYLTRGILLWGISLLRVWFGWGALWIALFLCILGVTLLRQKPLILQKKWWKASAWFCAALLSMAFLSVLRGTNVQRAEAGLDGGMIGWGLARLLGSWWLPLGLVGRILLGFLLLFGSAFFVTLALGWIKKLWFLLQEPTSHTSLEIEPTVSIAPIQTSPIQKSGKPAEKRNLSQLPREFRKRLQSPEPKSTISPLLPERDERLPPLDVLVQEAAFKPDERTINLTAGLIEKTLAEFGIPAKVVGYRVGPTITQYAVEPGFLEKNGGEGDIARQKVRVAQIAALNRDLALALSAERLRIEAPVPGRPYIGIEVPNSRTTVVRLRPILEHEAFYKVASPLAIALGRDVSGNPVVGDLAKMPHLLIAGTTGSGKSVCIASLTTCLVMNNTPEELRLVMIDPKMVELIRFNGLPHLLGKVETKLERILGVLQWAVAEMDQRYRILESTHSRNLETYNKKASRRKDINPLPHIVIVIDELADLMMSAPEQTEPALIRLAQLARATGIHLIVATQRPSTDVVTGLIKANFPARIAFAVASSVDSRVILDTSGAEALLGHGDMLFLPPEASAPLRCQGVMVSDQEIERVITFWQNMHPPKQGEIPPWEDFLKENIMLEDHDALIEEAIKVVQKSRRASASLLQRKLHIGYPRAARIMDELEEMGVVGPIIGSSREREVYITDEEGDGEEGDD